MYKPSKKIDKNQRAFDFTFEERVAAHLVDGINAYFGWGEGSGKSLSIHVMKHYLSKPTEYPISAAMRFAIHQITESLEPNRVFTNAEGGEVISKEEKQHLMLRKMEAAMWETNRLERELKNEKWGFYENGMRMVRFCDEAGGARRRSGIPRNM
jgi:hypothetical protein